MPPLERAIIKTVAYFDIFDYPLTGWEIYAWLYVPSADLNISADYQSIREVLLKSNNLQERLETKHGFYFLKGRDDIIKTRQKRYLISYKKIKKLKRAVKLWAILPYVRMIAICNNLAFLNAKKEGDLDVFIITAPRALPLVRLLTVFTSILFFKRPTANHQGDSICLSFLVDEREGNITHLAITPLDIYLTYWMATIQPVYEYHSGIYRHWLSLNDKLCKFVPYHIPRTSVILQVRTIYFIKKILERLLILFTKPNLATRLFDWQMRRLPRSIKAKMNQSSSVVVTHSMFKSHLNDRRYEIKHEWEKRVSAFCDS